MGALRAKMERDLVVRGLSERTGQGYLRSVTGLVRHYGRAPDTLTVAEVETSLVHLRRARQLTWESLATVVPGLRFFYEVTLGRRRAQFFIPEGSRQEVARVLAQTTHRRDRTLLLTTYAAGLRVSEVVALQVAHLDSERMVMRIEQGKGRRDRYALLSARLLAELRAYWRVSRLIVPTSWPGTSTSSGGDSSRTSVRSAGALVSTRPSRTTSPRSSSRHHTVDFACTSMPRYRTASSLRVEHAGRLDRQ